MPRGVGLDRGKVVDAASALIDAEGPDALTLARLADGLGVRSPSLFKHVAGLDDLRGALVERAYAGLDRALEAADDPSAVATAWRAFAREHPGLYALSARTHLDAPAGARAAGDATLHRVLAALAPLVGSGEDAVHAARALRALVHGFVLLEASGGFGLPESVDASFARAVAALVRGLAVTPSATPRVGATGSTARPAAGTPHTPGTSTG